MSDVSRSGSVLSKPESRRCDRRVEGQLSVRRPRRGVGVRLDWASGKLRRSRPHL